MSVELPITTAQDLAEHRVVENLGVTFGLVVRSLGLARTVTCGIKSLRRFKDDVTEVKTDFEAGIGLGKFNDIQVGDEIETTELVEKPRV